MNALRRFWHAWQQFGRFIGNWVGRIIISVFYFTIMLPFGVAVTLFGDPLHIRRRQPPFWLSRETPSTALEDARRQF